MEKICRIRKSKFSDCMSCPLSMNDDLHKLVLGESNCNLKDTQLMILAEAPALEETKRNKPLVGRAGTRFRQAFESSGLNKFNYFITNSVLCSNLYVDPKTGNVKTKNPPPEAVMKCRSNWLKFLELCKPEYVLLMGGTILKSFGINKNDEPLSGYVNKQFVKRYKGNSFTVYVTYHPSFILRKGGNGYFGDMFDNAFVELRKSMFQDHERKLLEHIDDRPISVKRSDGKSTDNTNGMYGQVVDKVHSYDFPEEVLSGKYALIDAQVLPTEVLFLMKDREKRKKIFRFDKYDYYYYLTMGDPNSSEYIRKSSGSQLVVGNCAEMSDKYTLYESDIGTETKRTIDYYYRIGDAEPTVKLDVLYCDIEVYNYGSREFPEPTIAKSPINAISFKLNDDITNVYMVDPKALISEEGVNIDIGECNEKFGISLKLFSSEKELLSAFCGFVTSNDFDIMTGWNFIGFDIIYIYNRLLKNDINPNDLSPLGYTRINVKQYGDVLIAGYYILDMLDLYKSFTSIVRSSYKLGAIAKLHLGEDKVEFEGTLDKLYKDDIFEFVHYSYKDTDLLRDLARKLGHIDLRNEIRRICASTWKGAETTIGLIDPLCILYAKRNNTICKSNYMNNKKKESFEGAYVRHPVPGIHRWLIDLDFKSLYPSLIQTFNIGPDTYIGKIDPRIADQYIYRKDILPDDIPITINPITTKECRKFDKSEFLSWVNENKATVTAYGSIFMGHDIKKSFFNNICDYLISSRDLYKKKRDSYKDGTNNGTYESEIDLYDNIQWAYKILVNSLYGALGNEYFRLFILDLAKSITISGKEVAIFSGYHLSNYMVTGELEVNPNFRDNYEDYKEYLIYQDTDSVFLDMGSYLNDKLDMDI